VDWEHFSEVSAPLEDLFHFPLTYGFNYPWSRYRRRPPEQAFHLGFLAETEVSRGVRRYFETYCKQADICHEWLEPLFRFFLLERWAQGDRAGGGPEAGSRGSASLWLKLYRMLDKADRSVFSG
jgi:hypothetical protein